MNKTLVYAEKENGQDVVKPDYRRYVEYLEAGRLVKVAESGGHFDRVTFYHAPDGNGYEVTRQPAATQDYVTCVYLVEVPQHELVIL